MAGPGAGGVGAPREVQREELPSRAEMGTFFSFRYPGFRWLWLGNAFSSAAQWMHITTLAWVVFDITGSELLLGAIVGVGNLATPLVAPIAGLAADRFRRNRVIAFTQVLLFLNALLLGFALVLDAVQVWMLFAFAIWASIMNGINMTNRQAIVFDVVPREVGPNAVALSNMAMNVMRTLGPAIGGGMIAFFGAGSSFFLQAATYILVMVTVLQIHVAARPAGTISMRTVLGDMAAGYRWVAGSRPARVLILLMIIYPLFIIPVHTALVVVFGEDVFDTGAGGMGTGLLLSALGLGGIIGGVLTAALNRVERRGLMQLYSMLACGGFLALFALLGGLTGMFWVGIVMLVLSGVGGAMFNTTNQTVVQLIAPDHLRGRITSVLHVQPLFMAAGIFTTGVIAEHYGVVSVGTALGLLAVGAVTLVFVLSPQMRGLHLSRLIEARQ